MPSRRSGTALAVLALALAGCGSGGAADRAAPGENAGPVVVTSTNVYGAVARAVGGDRVTVESLITDPAADPHSYESTPADAAKVSGAALVVFNGGGYDDWMTQLVEATGTGAPVIDVVGLSGEEPAEEPGTEEPAHAEGEAGHAEGEAHSEGDGHAEGEAGHGAFDEHVWYSLPVVQELATRLATELGTIDAAGAATYTANAEAFRARVTELVGRQEAVAAAHPGVRVAVTEPVASRLVEAAGLSDVTPEEFAEAIEEDTDPPAAVLQETLALFGAEPVGVLLLNAQTQTPTTDQVRQAAQTAGVPVVEVSETLPEGETDYVNWMGGQIDALAAALDR